MQSTPNLFIYFAWQSKINCPKQLCMFLSTFRDGKIDSNCVEFLSC